MPLRERRSILLGPGDDDACPQGAHLLRQLRNDLDRAKEMEAHGRVVAPRPGAVLDMVTAGVALQTIIGPANERWDDVALAEYGSRELFVQGWEAFADEETAAAFADTRMIAVRLTTSRSISFQGAS